MGGIYNVSDGTKIGLVNVGGFIGSTDGVQRQ